MRDLRAAEGVTEGRSSRPARPSVIALDERMELGDCELRARRFARAFGLSSPSDGQARRSRRRSLSERPSSRFARADLADLQASALDRWSHAFDCYELLLLACRESGLAFESGSSPRQSGQQPSNPRPARALGSITVVGGEVLVLLRSGYGSGAFARWRTLDELAIVALFVGDSGPEVADRFVVHRGWQSDSCGRSTAITLARTLSSTSSAKNGERWAARAACWSSATDSMAGRFRVGP